MKVLLVVPSSSGNLSVRQDEVVIIIPRATGRGQGTQHRKDNAGADCVQGRRCHKAVGVFSSCGMLRERVAHGAQVVVHQRRRNAVIALVAILQILCIVSAESCHNVRDPTAPPQAVEETTHTTRILEKVVKVLLHGNGVAVCRALSYGAAPKTLGGQGILVAKAEPEADERLLLLDVEAHAVSTTSPCYGFAGTIVTTIKL